MTPLSLAKFIVIGLFIIFIALLLASCTVTHKPESICHRLKLPVSEVTVESNTSPEYFEDVTKITCKRRK